MANLQSQIDILAKAIVKEHIGFEEYKVNNKGSVTLSEISRKVNAYDNKGVDMGGGEQSEL